MTDLIKRLRDLGDHAAFDPHMHHVAADCIEELVKERDELGRKLNTARYGQPDFAWSIHEEAMADLRVKLAKAVEAIKQSIQKWESPHYGDENIKIDNAFDGFELLRTTLAELEGQP